MNRTVYEAYCRGYQAAYRVAMKALDWTEPQLLKGPGSVKELPKLIKAKGITNVLVVTDGGLSKIGLPNGLYEALEKEEIAYVVYDGVQPNPTIDNVEDARAMYQGNGCQAIIAFGGGSPMDCAKAAGARIARPNKTIPELRGQLKVLKKIPLLFAVPTTAGTGSETTVAAVISNPKTHEKNAINDPHLRPKFAVLDPELTLGLPPHITSTTGMDALTHAVEAYIGQDNVDYTEDAARKAVKLIYANLETAYNDGSNIEARGAMLEASYLAGVAFTRAYVGYVHAIAHNLGGMYGIAHGLANAVILPYVLEYYGDSASQRLGELAMVAGLDVIGKPDSEKAAIFIESIKQMNRNMNIPDKIPQIKEEDVSLIADRALLEGNPLYPVPKIMNKEECVAIIHQLMV